MNEFLPGDVFFVMHKRNPISKVIAWAMGSKWSHCGIVIGTYRNQYVTCETTDFEIAPKTLGVYLDDEAVEIEVLRGGSFSDDEIEDMNIQALELLWKVYPYLQLFSLGLRRALARIKIKIANFIHYNLVCCGVPITILSVTSQSLGIKPTSIDTEELYEILKNKGWKTVFHKGDK